MPLARRRSPRREYRVGRSSNDDPGRGHCGRVLLRQDDGLAIGRQLDRSGSHRCRDEVASATLERAALEPHTHPVRTIARAPGRAGELPPGVALDDEGWEAVKPYIEAKQVNYPVVVGSEEVDMKYGGIEGLPTTFIIDRTGMIVEKHVGFASKDQFEQSVRKLL